MKVVIASLVVLKIVIASFVMMACADFDDRLSHSADGLRGDRGASLEGAGMTPLAQAMAKAYTPLTSWLRGR